MISQLVESAKQLKYYKHRKIITSFQKPLKKTHLMADLTITSGSKAPFEVHLFIVRLNSFEDFHPLPPQLTFRP